MPFRYADCKSEIRRLEEEIENLRAENKRVYAAGFRDGLAQYAWWTDGEQYVGSCGTTLRQAIERLERELQ